MAEKENEKITTRPFILSVFCIALFVYTGMLSIIFMLVTLFNRPISITVADFFPERMITRENILLLSIVGAALNLLSFFSVMFIWRMKRTGLYVFTLASLIFLLLPFFMGFGDFTSLIIMGIIIAVLFLFHNRLK
jgi:hypothetical protein